MSKSWCVVAVVLPVLLALVSLYALDMYMMCGHDIIAEVCEQHRQQEVTGSLCHDLCKSKTILKTKCLSTNPEKIVNEATWKGKEIILKYDTHMSVLNSYSYEHLKDENDYKNEIAAAVNMLFGESENFTALKNKLVKTADVNNDGHLSLMETMMILQLLRTTEPSMLLILNGSQVAVDFLGFCGRLYAVEKLAVIADTVYGLEISWEDLVILPNSFEPVENLIKQSIVSIFGLIKDSSDVINNYIEPLVLKFKTFISRNYMSRTPSIEERFKFVLDMLDIIFEISNSSNSLVQACDIHLGNFGMTQQNKLKFLDCDLIYPIHYLKQLLSSKKCSNDDECRIGHFDDCTSMCNKTTGFCSGNLNSHMLQNICATGFPLIFRNIYMDFKDHNQTEMKCLENMVQKVSRGCLKMASAENLTRLHSHVNIVKEAFFLVSKQNSYCSP